MTRARAENPNHLPWGARYAAGLRISSSGDLTGAKIPACHDFQLRPESADIYGDEEVSRTVGHLGLDALEQRVLAAVDTVDPDAGLLREILVERLVGLIVPRGVQVEDWVLRGSGRQTAPRGRSGQ